MSASLPLFSRGWFTNKVFLLCLLLCLSQSWLVYKQSVSFVSASLPLSVVVGLQTKCFFCVCFFASLSRGWFTNKVFLLCLLLCLSQSWLVYKQSVSFVSASLPLFSRGWLTNKPGVSLVHSRHFVEECPDTNVICCSIIQHCHYKNQLGSWLSPWMAHPLTSHTVPMSQVWLYLPFPFIILGPESYVGYLIVSFTSLQRNRQKDPWKDPVGGLLEIFTNKADIIAHTLHQSMLSNFQHPL